MTIMCDLLVATLTPPVATPGDYGRLKQNYGGGSRRSPLAFIRFTRRNTRLDFHAAETLLDGTVPGYGKASVMAVAIDPFTPVTL